MPANKVILNGDTIIDLTQDTVTAEDVVIGKTFHGADGEQKVGTLTSYGDAESPPWVDSRLMTSTYGFFYNGANLELLSALDTSNATNMASMFYGCDKLTAIPAVDTSNATNMSGFFRGCNKLTAIPALDTSNATNMANMFYGCNQLTAIPALDTSNATNVGYMFYGCNKLTAIPALDTSNATEMNYMFYNCRSLVTITQLDMRGKPSNSAMLYGCVWLTNICLKNITMSVQVGSGESWGYNLTMESLLSLINEVAYHTSTTTSRTLTVGTRNMAKFVGEYEYVKPTGVYLDFDDNEIAELTEGCKIPAVWCNSTDEGAMTIVDYMASKGWDIK